MIKEKAVNHRARLSEGGELFTTHVQLTQHSQGPSQCLTGGTAPGHSIIHIMKEVTGEGWDAEPRNLQGIAAATTKARKCGSLPRMWKLLDGQLETLLLKHSHLNVSLL